jgi:hypothetical protein
VVKQKQANMLIFLNVTDVTKAMRINKFSMLHLRSDRLLENFNIEKVEILWQRVPPPAPQAQAELVAPLSRREGRIRAGVCIEEEL